MYRPWSASSTTCDQLSRRGCAGRNGKQAKPIELADQGLYIAKRSGRNAWAALCGTDACNADPARAEGLFARLMHHLPRAVDEGEARLLSNLAGPLELDGERRRVGLSSDLEV